jgi:hypothetical protein
MRDKEPITADSGTELRGKTDLYINLATILDRTSEAYRMKLSERLSRSVAWGYLRVIKSDIDSNRPRRLGLS